MVEQDDKIAAETAKLMAEAEKIQIEISDLRTRGEAGAEKDLALARKADAEAKKFEAETVEAVAKARMETLKASVAEFEHDRQKEKRDRELADFKYGRVYMFDQPVSSKSVDLCVQELRYWNRIDPGCDIEICFDSPGGSVFDGLSLYDYIQELRRDGHHITTSTRGMAASMGGILLQAGDKRVMGAEAWILIHEVSTVTGGKIGEIEDEVELIKKIQERVLGIFAARSRLSKPALRRRWRRRDWWVDSTEAKKLGLVDEVR